MKIPLNPPLRKGELIEETSFYVACLTVLFVPLSFSLSVFRSFSLPKAFVFYLLLAALACMTVIRNTIFRSSLKASLLNILLILFCITLLPSVLFSINPSTTFIGSYRQLSGVLSWISMVLFAICVSQIRWDSNRTRDLVNVITISAAAVSIIAWIQYFYPQINEFFYLPVTKRPVYSTLGNATYLAAFLAFCIPVVLFLLLEARTALSAITYGAVNMLSIGALAFTGSRGGWIAILASLAIVLFFSRMLNIGWRKAILVIGLSIVIFVLALFIPVTSTDLKVLSGNKTVSERLYQETGTLQARLGYWQAAVTVALKHPFTGTGPDTFGIVYPKLSSKASQSLEPETVTDDSHNIFLQIAANYGLPATILFIIILISAFWNCYKLKTDSLLPLFGIATGTFGYLMAVQTTVNSWGTSFIPFLFIGIAASSSKISQVIIKKINRGYLIQAAIITGTICLFIALPYLYKLYTADRYFAKAHLIPMGQRAPLLYKAAILWQNNEFYWLTLAEDLAGKDPKRAAWAIEQAIKASPAYYLPYQFQAQFYLTDGARLPGSNKLAKKAEQKGLERFPNSKRLQELLKQADNKKPLGQTQGL